MPSRLLACLAVLLAATAHAAPVDYARDVKPILKERCYACHGALKQKAKLRLDTARSIRKGGTAGPAIEPGEPTGACSSSASPTPTRRSGCRPRASR